MEIEYEEGGERKDGNKKGFGNVNEDSLKEVENFEEGKPKISEGELGKFFYANFL